MKTMSPKKLIYMVLAFITGCATPQKPISQEEKMAEAESYCLERAINRLSALQAFKMSKLSDHETRKAYLSHEASGSYREQQEIEMDLWERSHSPQLVAHSRFNFCAKQEGYEQQLHLDRRGETCFSMELLPVSIVLLRDIGLQREDIKRRNERGARSMGLSDENYERLLNDIFAAKSDREKNRIKADFFRSCLKTSFN